MNLRRFLPVKRSTYNRNLDGVSTAWKMVVKSVVEHHKDVERDLENVCKVLEQQNSELKELLQAFKDEVGR